MVGTQSECLNLKSSKAILAGVENLEWGVGEGVGGGGRGVPLSYNLRISATLSSQGTGRYPVALLPVSSIPQSSFVSHLLAVRAQGGQASEELVAPQGLSFPDPIQEAPLAKCRLQPARFRSLVRTSLERFPCQPTLISGRLHYLPSQKKLCSFLRVSGQNE